MRSMPDGSEVPRTRRGQYVISEDGKIVDTQTPVTPADSLRLALEKL